MEMGRYPIRLYLSNTPIISENAEFRRSCEFLSEPAWRPPETRRTPSNVSQSAVGRLRVPVRVPVRGAALRGARACRSRGRWWWGPCSRTRTARRERLAASARRGLLIVKAAGHAVLSAQELREARAAEAAAKRAAAGRKRHRDRLGAAGEGQGSIEEVLRDAGGRGAGTAQVHLAIPPRKWACRVAGVREPQARRGRRPARRREARAQVPLGSVQREKYARRGRPSVAARASRIVPESAEQVAARYERIRRADEEEQERCVRARTVDARPVTAAADYAQRVRAERASAERAASRKRGAEALGAAGIPSDVGSRRARRMCGACLGGAAGIL